MKIIGISKNGISTPKALPVNGNRGQYFCLMHGENGRGRWQLRMPLAAREFPVPSDEVRSIEMTGEFKLIDLNRKDPRENTVYLIAKGEEDGKQLVLLSLSPGYRGGARYTVTGQAEVIGEGEEAQGAAGRMGGAACPLIIVSGPCQINWHRSGRLYGGDADWSAVYDGSEWVIGPRHECAAEDAAFSY